MGDAMTPRERQDPAWRQQEPPDPPEDDHLMDDYDDRMNGGFDFNPIEQGLWDDDPDIYGGEYSEE